MPTIDELLTDQFYRWELRGRGWYVFDYPVAIEPPFRPFFGHYLSPLHEIDDGRRPTVGGNIARWFGRTLSAPPPAEPATPSEEEPEPLPEWEAWPSSVELQVFLPPTLSIDRECFDQFLLSLSECRSHVVYEIVALPPHLCIQFTVHPDDAALVRAALQAFFPEAVVKTEAGTMEAGWRNGAKGFRTITDFGLEQEFMLPLSASRAEIAVAVAAALSDLSPGEVGVFQVIFKNARRPWAASGLVAVTDDKGGPFFANVPELLPGAKRKFGRPLFAVVLRLAVCGATQEHTEEILRRIRGALLPLSDPSGNRLIALPAADYPSDAHEDDFLNRTTRRPGMLLNSDELAAIARLPSPAVRSERLRRQTTRTKRAPATLFRSAGIMLGENDHAGRREPVRLSAEERSRHVHIIGASGTGKSTLLFNLVRQGIDAGEGLAVLDPHGDLIDRILGIIPPERTSDVVLVDPGDEEYSVGFNILSAHSDFEKNLLASDLVSIFERLSTSWGDQMASVLRNAIGAFIESDRGGTLADLRRFLLEPGFRDEFLRTVRDPDVLYYWHTGFRQLTGNRSVGPILTRLDNFLFPKPIRHMVSQKENRLDIAAIMDTGKIILAKLSQGVIGKENSYLLGSLLISKFQQLAMTRQRQAEESRRSFTLYVDEFHNFITPSMAEILSGARKYRLGLVLCHQELGQLERDREVGSAVLSNSCVRVCFRVGDKDARSLAEGFSYFEARDLQNLDIGQAVVRVERSDADFNLIVPPATDPADAERRRGEVVAKSRQAYGTPRSTLEPVATPPAQKSPPRTPAPPSQSSPPDPPSPAPVVPVPPPPPPPAKLSPVAVSQAQEEPVRPPVIPEPGKGGAQHKALQRRLKAVAESLGFSVTIEKRLPPGLKSIDLLLERPALSLACEIAVTTTVDHEVGNIQKCLQAKFSNVVIISPSKAKLGEIERAARSALGAESLATVSFFGPDEFIAHLQSLALPPPSETKRGGYTVKRSYVALPPEQAKAREQAVAESLVSAARRRKRKS